MSNQKEVETVSGEDGTQLHDHLNVTSATMHLTNEYISRNISASTLV
jgi:hypothetical protein